MLLQFGVENYKCIKDYQELDLEAIASYKEHPCVVCEEDTLGTAGARYLKSAYMFGANASGKTAFVNALGSLKYNLLKKLDESLVWNPFLLDNNSEMNPTKYYIHFKHNNNRYKYYLSIKENTVVSESLYAYPNGRKQTWFIRDSSASNINVTDSHYFSIPKSSLQLLSDNNTILGTFSKLTNMSACKKATEILDWFLNSLDICYGMTESARYPFSGEILDSEDASDFQKLYIKSMVKKYDLGIEDVEVQTREYQVEDIIERKKIVVFKHKGENRNCHMDIFSESEGTRQIFTLSGHIAKALEHGGTLVIDEFDASLHPMVMSEIIKTWNNPDINIKGAQLIVNSHNLLLLNDDFIRRDQIWFFDKNANGESSLFALSEYAPRLDDLILKKYLIGKYSGVPIIENDNFDYELMEFD